MPVQSLFNRLKGEQSAWPERLKPKSLPGPAAVLAEGQRQSFGHLINCVVRMYGFVAEVSPRKHSSFDPLIKKAINASNLTVVLNMFIILAQLSRDEANE
jgi:hypothetical protein